MKEFHPFSNVPADECMCCGGKFEEVGQSLNDAELCPECYLDVVDFPMELPEVEDFYIE